MILDQFRLDGQVALVTGGSRGLGLGIAAALAVTPLMGSLLFGVEARDPAVFASTVIVLSTAALLATCIPAYRATRVDPVTALRWE